LIRRPFPYKPSLGHTLRQLSPSTSHAIWLRLGQPGLEVFCAYPTDTFKLAHQEDSCRPEGRTSDIRLFWEGLSQWLAEQKIPAGPADLPFRGGLAGFIGYEAGVTNAFSKTSFPGAFFGVYTHFLHIDHHRQTAEEIILDNRASFLGEWQKLVHEGATTTFAPSTASAAPPFSLDGAFEALTPKSEYEKHFKQIQQYLLQGDCYQVNYAQAFTARCRGSSAEAMQQLLTLSNPPYAAWLSLPEGDVLSLSPELLLEVKGRQLLTRPIKGTAPRHIDLEMDINEAAQLRASPKNRAENLMIVDLLRNDLSQHAETGSVRVANLFEVETLPQVHHLVSTITAKLKKDAQSIDVLKDCFPGGSITGAPKKRAMEIIAELETTPRSVYCGSIGFINTDGDCQFNIAIRTLLRRENEIRTWAGGGIVADSDCEAEYQECFHKMGALMRALEEMGNKR
jgi:para-aminobenzoate synthetase component I